MAPNTVKLPFSFLIIKKIYTIDCMRKKIQIEIWGIDGHMKMTDGVANLEAVYAAYESIKTRQIINITNKKQ